MAGRAVRSACAGRLRHGVSVRTSSDDGERCAGRYPLSGTRQVTAVPPMGPAPTTTVPPAVAARRAMFGQPPTPPPGAPTPVRRRCR